MLLGKRPRPPMRRTASMTGIEIDVSHQKEGQQPPPGGHGGERQQEHHYCPELASSQNSFMNNNNMNGGFDYSNYLAMVSPRFGTHRLTEFIETAQFLRTCGLCQRGLVSGQDIYMYRGDTAFCSLECREQQIKQDEKREKRCSNGAALPSKSKR